MQYEKYSRWEGAGLCILQKMAVRVYIMKEMREEGAFRLPCTVGSYELSLFEEEQSFEYLRPFRLTVMERTYNFHLSLIFWFLSHSR